MIYGFAQLIVINCYELNKIWSKQIRRNAYIKLPLEEQREGNYRFLLSIMCYFILFFFNLNCSVKIAIKQPNWISEAIITHRVFFFFKFPLIISLLLLTCSGLRWLEWQVHGQFRIINGLLSCVNRRTCLLGWIGDYADEKWHCSPHAVRLNDKEDQMFLCASSGTVIRSN